jgi:hypothetical protein
MTGDCIARASGRQQRFPASATRSLVGIAAVLSLLVLAAVKSLLTLQRLTREGTDPKVLAIQEGDEGKPGAPLIPKGLHIEVANDPGFDVQHAYGLSEQVGFAFIGSDGKVHKLFNKAPTDQQLQDALDALH